MPLEVPHDDAAADVDHPRPCRLVNVPILLPGNRLALKRLFFAERRHLECALAAVRKLEERVGHPSGRAVIALRHVDPEDAPKYLLSELLFGSEPATHGLQGRAGAAAGG